MVQKVETGDEAFAEWHKQIDAALAGNHFDLAFRLSQRRMIDEAMQWFREDGIEFVRPAGEVSGRELVVSLSIAAQKAVQERGDAASLKIQTAAQVLHAVAVLRISLEPNESEPRSKPVDQLGAMLLGAARLGALDSQMALVRLGHFDQLAEHAFQKEKQRRAANKTNQIKATNREKALAEAIEICAKNPRLPNEDLALKIRDRLKSNSAVRTITGWVREWRRSGDLPPVKG